MCSVIYCPLTACTPVHVSALLTTFMMTSSNGNIFRVTGPLCGEFTGPGEFPAQRTVTRSFDVFFDLRPNKWLSKQPWGWWFETPSWSLWRHCNVIKSAHWYICFKCLYSWSMAPPWFGGNHFIVPHILLFYRIKNKMKYIYIITQESKGHWCFNRSLFYNGSRVYIHS